MARVDISPWVQEQYGSPVLERIRTTSAIEAYARREPMATDAKTLPRGNSALGVTVTPKGTAYNEEQVSSDEITLQARKFTGLLRIAEEDVADLPGNGVANFIQQRQLDWAGNFARFYDNACLGTSAAANGTTVPFTSLYRALTTADAAVGYTAGANVISTGGAVTYDDLSGLLAFAEGSDFYDLANMLVIAHPSLLRIFRDLRDTQGRPIFEGQGQANQEASLFGLPLRFSAGAKVSATATYTPAATAGSGAGGAAGTAGNPLLFVVNRQALVNGVRSGPEYVTISGWDGASAVTDEALIKMRARRGFVVGDVRAAAVLELTNA